MAITRKPKAAPPATVNVDALINKGGSVTQLAAGESAQRPIYVQLRLTTELVDRIDQSLQGRPIKTPRHTWLLEAIHEKLKREG